MTDLEFSKICHLESVYWSSYAEELWHQVQEVVKLNVPFDDKQQQKLHSLLLQMVAAKAAVGAVSNLIDGINIQATVAEYELSILKRDTK